MTSLLSIYIHWPFCKSKCPYCDFNSHVRAAIDDKRWREALLDELRCYAEKTQDRQIVSVFFGGGTPSLMQQETVKSLIDAIHELWPVSQDIEITLEANPTSVEAEKFRNFYKAGINRVSIGVQSFLPDALKFLGREHSANEAIEALKLAHDIFPRMSFDLIYARPDQTLAEWEKELTAALQYAKDHISLYQLTIEENTAFHYTYHNGGFALPEDSLSADMYTLTQEITGAHGLPAYEISNHARPGGESRHNLAYWRSQDYIGIGAGAHGRYSVYNGEHAAPDFSPYPLTNTRLATENIKSPERWLEKVEQHGNGLNVETIITEKESVEEAIMMGLRLSNGINYDDWKNRLGFDLQAKLTKEPIQKLADMSLIIADDVHIKTTEKGRLLLNSVTKELLVHII